MTSPHTALLALIGLLAVAVTWGSSFPLTKVVLQELSTPDFLAVRFVLATVVMLLVFHRAVRALPRAALLRGGALGLLYGAGQLVQTAGLERTPASVSGFITGLYVVLTPICAAILLRTSIGRRVWVGAVLAAIGLGFLALNGSLTPGPGELLTLASALLYALHIVGLSAWTRPDQALGLAVVQIAGTAALSVVFAIPGDVELPHTPGVWVAVVYMALVSGAIAMIVQSWAQAHLAASRAAIIMSTEPLWATVFSVTFFDEPLTARIVIGGATILAAMLVVELRPRTGPPGPHGSAGPADPPDPRQEDLPKLAP